MATIAENIQTLRSIKSDIKNAILAKGGVVTDAFGGYAQAITNLPSGGGGGTEMEDALITRTLSVYSNDRVSMVGNYAFYYYPNLTYVNLPNCKSVGRSAFASCSVLQSISLQNCLYISSNTFMNCSTLSSIDLTNCSYIDYGGFVSCWALSLIKLPICEYIGNWTFNYCSSLFQVYLNSVSSVTTIQSGTFKNCPNLTSVYVPSSLVNAFKTARYWSSISNKIVAYTEA